MNLPVIQSIGKRIWMISDTHFGVRNNSHEWHDIHKDYFYNFYIPMVKAHRKDGDILVHIGDLFDSRQALNLRIMDFGMNLIKELSELFEEVHIVVGNHDIYKKESNDINSLKPLNWIPNVNVYEDPVMLKFPSDKKALIMPWQFTRDAENNIVTNNSADYLFCHTDINGLKFNKWVDIDDGLASENLGAFKRVYSGHIHYAQTYKNIRMVGSPYSMTRSDIGNEKGVWILDVESGEDYYTKNTQSPIFIIESFDKIINLTLDEVIAIVNNNYVDITLPQRWSGQFPMHQLLEQLEGYRRFRFVPINENESVDAFFKGTVIDHSENFNILKLSREYIENTKYPEGIKKRMINTIENLYLKVTRQEEDEIDI